MKLLTGPLGWFGSLLLRFVGGGLAGELRGALQDWRDAETEQQRIAAKERVDTIGHLIEADRVQADVVTAGMQHGGRIFWSVWALFAVPLGLWFAAVTLDSIWLFSGNIPDLPDSIRPYADQIFNSIFYSGATMGAAQAGATVIGRAIARR